MTEIKAKEISLEDAMLLAGFGKYNVFIFSLCVIIMTGMVFETLGLSYIIPAAQCDLDLTLTEKGLLAAVPFIGIIVSSHFWGWLADTRGRKPVIMYSMAIGSFFSVISSLCPDLISFAVLRFIAAIFLGAPSSIVVAYLGEFNNPRDRDRLVIFTCAFISVGSLLLTAVAWLILSLDYRIELESIGVVYRPWRLLILVLALPYVVCSFVMIRAPESPKYLASQGKSKQALKIVKKMYFMNKGTSEDPFKDMFLEYHGPKTTSVSVLKSMMNQTLPLFRRPLLFYTSIACFAQFVTFANTNGFYLWLPEILNKMMNQQVMTNAQGTICEVLSADTNFTVDHEGTEFTITECFDVVHSETFVRSMILGAIYTPVPILVAFFVHRIGKRTILSLVPFFSGISAYAIYWTTNQNISLVLLAVMQIDSCCIGVMNAVVVELYPTHLRAMIVSLSLMCGRIGSILGGNIIGYLFEVNCPVNFFLFGSLLLANSIICLLLPKTT